MIDLLSGFLFTLLVLGVAGSIALAVVATLDPYWRDDDLKVRDWKDRPKGTTPPTWDEGGDRG